jgi:hypothetical protein
MEARAREFKLARELNLSVRSGSTLRIAHGKRKRYRNAHVAAD